MNPLQLAGFGLASLAVMGNDALQTLGPFLASQRGRGNRWRQGLVLAAVLCVVLPLSWAAGAGDPAWGRLDRFPLPDPFRWRDLLPLVALLLLTRLGMPVSTSFLVLTAMAPVQLGGMVRKSLAGYGVAFALAALAYGLWAPWLEGRRSGAAGRPEGAIALDEPHTQMLPIPGTGDSGADRGPPEVTLGPAAATLGAPTAARGAGFPWPVVQWLATVALWSQWLVQDLANIYIYLPRRLNLAELLVTLVVLCGAVALIVTLGGGPIQGRLRGKSHIADPRATTVITLLYGLVLLLFLGGDRLPMSTSWLFLGLLAGREVGLACRGVGRPAGMMLQDLTVDLLRAAAGLATSLAVALLVAADRA
ncbi:MAG: hypothetical protein VKO39_07630 [Cyanobacteriota bacterium]|nr:hypothetical protein [Cyanobacteriota bacterium]